MCCVHDPQEMYSANSHLMVSGPKGATGGRRKGDLTEVDVGTAGLTPAQRMQRRMKELNVEVSTYNTFSRNVAHISCFS